MEKKNKEKWGSLKEGFFDILFPRFCVGCRKEGKYICSKCSEFLSENSLVCPMCGESSFTGTSHKTCARRYGLDGLVSGWDYEGIIKKTIWDIKEGQYHMGEKTVERLFTLMVGQKDRFQDFLKFSCNKNIKIAYVPTGNEKLINPINKLKNPRNKNMIIFKGNKHAEILSKAVSEIIEKETVDLLEKVRETKKQANLKKEERLENVRGAFEAKRKSPENIILVDDVFTTGATLRECCKILKKAGAKKVWGLTLARTC